MTHRQTACTAFAGSRRIASGPLEEVALASMAVLNAGEQAPVLVFDDRTSEPVEIDFRGTAEDVLRRFPEAAGEAAPAEERGDNARGPGRPRLGVVARE